MMIIAEAEHDGGRALAPRWLLADWDIKVRSRSIPVSPGQPGGDEADRSAI